MKTRVDFTAVMQGPSDALDNGEISKGLYDQVYLAIRSVSFQATNGRYVCDYDKLLRQLATVRVPETHQMGRLWERLGKSLSDGLGVAN